MAQIKFEDNSHGANYVMVCIRGNTYPHRELLKEMGLYFSGSDVANGPYWYTPQPMYRDTNQFVNMMKSTKALADAGADVVIELVDA